MRAAPPAVDIPLGSGRRERVAAALLYGLSGMVVAGWLALLNGRDPVVPTLLCGLLGAAAGACILRPLHGRLRWDGAAWGFIPARGRGTVVLRRVHLQIDLGGWMLLRIEPSLPGEGLQRPAWCGVAQADLGAAWHGVRLALHQAPMDAAELTPADGATR